MMLTKEAMYAVNELNSSRKSIFGIDIEITEPSKFREFLVRGKDVLTQNNLIIEEKPTDELIELGYLLDKYNNSKEYLVVGDMIIAFTPKSIGVIVLSKYEDDEYTIEAMYKGYILLGIFKQISFLQKTTEFAEGEEKALDLETLTLGLFQSQSTILQYYKRNNCLYDKILVNFEDGIIEYDLNRSRGRLVPASKIRHLITEWTKVGREEDESKYENRL